MLSETLRWFGKNDPISLDEIKMTGTTNIVTALHDIPIGEIWTLASITELNEYIKSKGMKWLVVESIPVHESIKYGGSDREIFINNYIESIKNISKAGINILCYNFMPVVDWTRTNLMHKCDDGTYALKFDIVEFIIFDIYVLQRENAKKSYNLKDIKEAELKYKNITKKELERITLNILRGLPGSMVDSYDLESFRENLSKYNNLTKDKLQSNLNYFLKKIVPIAEKYNVYLGIHPDDPPINLFGIPRIVSNIEDYQFINDSYDSIYNGFTFCAGSLASTNQNIYKILDKFINRINFLHLRNVKKIGNSFIESDHLDGDVNMSVILSKIILNNQYNDYHIPFRPDHGHLMLDDIKKENINPGYSLLGRLKGLSELRGVISGLQFIENKQMTYEKFINLMKSDNNKIIPILKNKNELDNINFDYKLCEYVFRDNKIENILDIPNVSAGTVLTLDEVKFCISNNILIMFSPNLNKKLVNYCLKNNAILIPGVNTPTEILNAYELGVKVVKFFPANIQNLKNYTSLLNKLDIKFIVTGGVNNDNYKEILNIKNVIGVGSSSIKNI